tara:strand:- start:67 stop:246 length:180 start_codon:yes stop_codon:yes gene_type:complete
MPEGNLTLRLERHVRSVAGRKGANNAQIETILGLIKTIRDEGSISDESLLEIFDLVGGE